MPLPMPRSSSVRRPKVTHVNSPARPPKPGSPEHWQAWLQRYGGDYTTDAERRTAYEDFTTNLDTMNRPGFDAHLVTGVQPLAGLCL